MPRLTARQRYERSCKGKVRYSGRLVAANAAVALGWIGRPGMTAYRCSWCDYWHVGHERRRQ